MAYSRDSGKKKMGDDVCAGFTDLREGCDVAVKAMVCRNWDAHNSFGKYLSTELILSDRPSAPHNNRSDYNGEEAMHPINAQVVARMEMRCNTILHSEIAFGTPSWFIYAAICCVPVVFAGIMYGFKGVDPTFLFSTDSILRSEEIRKKTGYILMRAEGIYDVDANTSIYDLSEEFNVKLPEDHQYETVSGFVCEAFGYIPRTGERIKVLLERDNQEENDETESEHQGAKNKIQAYTLEILAANARKVSDVRFERLENANGSPESKDATQTVSNIMTMYRRSDDDSANKHLQKIEEYSIERSSFDNSIQESKADGSLDLIQLPDQLNITDDSVEQ